MNNTTKQELIRRAEHHWETLSPKTQDFLIGLSRPFLAAYIIAWALVAVPEMEFNRLNLILALVLTPFTLPLGIFITYIQLKNEVSNK